MRISDWSSDVCSSDLTADTEAYEFQSIYGLEVVVIPTNRPMIRVDNPDAVFLNRAGKYRVVVAELKDAHARNQPVLVGKNSIAVSELHGQQLSEAGFHHEVLTATHPDREPTNIAQAGSPDETTPPTNLAGNRGKTSWRERERQLVTI